MMNELLKSEWLTTQLEILKSLYGFDMNEIDDDMGVIDYSVKDDDHSKLLRVKISPNSKASSDSIENTAEKLEKEGYNEAIIVAEAFTKTAKKMITESDNLNYISNEGRTPYSTSQLLYAIQQKTWELCEMRCGKIPIEKGDCTGYHEDDSGKHYSCPVRRVSDDADFHAERGWKTLLVADFNNLIKLQREVNE
jgi:hypothetical protein